MDLLESLRNHQFQQDIPMGYLQPKHVTLAPLVEAMFPKPACDQPLEDSFVSSIKTNGWGFPIQKQRTMMEENKYIHLWFWKENYDNKSIGFFSYFVVISGCQMYSSSCSKDMRLSNTPIQTKNTLETWEFIFLLRITQGKHRSQKRKGNKESSGLIFVSV